ncbi:MAG TPA: response regulator transcription factor [Anaerolineaceae bacterium]|nr:response regulator transcription factor [Anaerolineaceae bacterium]HPN53028.1 response regulator transcription factor [Anaerolineaceae bacterium]
MTSELILLVDDEPNIIQLASLYLNREGYRVEAASDGPAALQSIARLQPALMVLDVMLPGMDGFEICRRLRAAGSNLPIIMVTARDDDIDKILGLELGADDYLTKPFNPRELVARVKAVLRRGGGQAVPESTQPLLRLGDVEIDPPRREVRARGRLVDLRTQEFEVLLVLARHAGLVLTREKLLELAWGYDFAGQTRTVDVHIGQLRRKLAGSAVSIETLTGVGYKLVIA